MLQLALAASLQEHGGGGDGDVRPAASAGAAAAENDGAVPAARRASFAVRLRSQSLAELSEDVWTLESNTALFSECVVSAGGAEQARAVTYRYVPLHTVTYRYIPEGWSRRPPGRMG